MKSTAYLIWVFIQLAWYLAVFAAIMLFFGQVLMGIALTVISPFVLVWLVFERIFS